MGTSRPCLALLALVAGCFGGGGGGPGYTPEPDAAPEAQSNLDLGGEYVTVERWNLAGGLSGHPELGEEVADLTIDIIVEVLGLPSILDYAAEVVLRVMLGQAISDFVNNTFPTELVAGGGFVSDLRDAFAEVDIEGRITLERDPADPNFYEGTEVLTRVQLHHGDRVIDASIANARAYATVYREWNTTVGVQTTIPYGDLVRAVAADLLGVDDVEAYAAETAGALDCQGLADAIAALQARVDDFGDAAADVAYWLDQAADVVLAGCADLENQVGDIVVPLLHTETHLLRGATGTILDTDGDLRVDRLDIVNQNSRYAVDNTWHDFDSQFDPRRLLDGAPDLDRAP